MARFKITYVTDKGDAGESKSNAGVMESSDEVEAHEYTTGDTWVEFSYLQENGTTVVVFSVPTNNVMKIVRISNYTT